MREDYFRVILKGIREGCALAEHNSLTQRAEAERFGVFCAEGRGLTICNKTQNAKERSCGVAQRCWKSAQNTEVFVEPLSEDRFKCCWQRSERQPRGSHKKSVKTTLDFSCVPGLPVHLCSRACLVSSGRFLCALVLLGLLFSFAQKAHRRQTAEVSKGDCQPYLVLSVDLGSQRTSLLPPKGVAKETSPFV